MKRTGQHHAKLLLQVAPREEVRQLALLVDLQHGLAQRELLARHDGHVHDGLHRRLQGCHQRGRRLLHRQPPPPPVTVGLALRPQPLPVQGLRDARPGYRV